MEKILKTLDAIKVPSLSGTDANIPGTITSAVVAAGDSIKTKKKERIAHCLAVTDAVCTQNVQTLPDYPKILESVSEVLFQLCNDSDSDIRLVASDCLNRMIRTLKDPHQSRFQMEVYKEIKKNQSPRSLRTALNVFAYMSSFIRPQKCRAFMASLLPCFAQISKRTEELLYESMANSLGEIFKNLGPFINDNEIKLLCKDFICNLESTSAIIRRSSANILVSICLYSRKPQLFLPNLLLLTTELLMPNLMEKSVSIIIGVLLCIRQCISPIYELMQKENMDALTDDENVTQNLIRIYEMCMILCNHDDHNVITTSLETLQQLLTSPAEKVIQRLTSPNGIQNSIDAEKWASHRTQSHLSSSATSMTFSEDATNLLDGDSELFRSAVASFTSDCKEELDIDISIGSERNSDVFATENADGDIGSSLEALQHSDEELTGKSGKPLVLQTFPEIFIGSLYEKNVPIYYCARSLAYNFLLSGQKGQERPDGEVRISVKVLATNCIINIVNLLPEIFKITLSAKNNDSSDKESSQTVQDLCLYASHNDPLLRGSIYILAGTYIKTALQSNLGCVGSIALELGSLIEVLKEGLQDSSNIGVKCAISGINNCLCTLWRCKLGENYAEEILVALLETVVNPYWLIKVDLVELFTSLEWDCIRNSKLYQQKVINVLVEFLTDEDIRVRSTVGSALVKFVDRCGSSKQWNLQRAHLFCQTCILDKVIQSKVGKCDSQSTAPEISQSLETVLNVILNLLGQLDDKYAMAGFYSVLATLSENYPPKLYKTAWRCSNHVTDVSLLFSITVDLLKSSPIVYDLQVHQSILILSCNLLLGLESEDNTSNIKEKPVDEISHPFIFTNQSVANYGLHLLQHCLAVMKLYQNVMESLNPAPFTRKLSNSPVISPVKKFSQKLEAEKKAQEAESDKKGKVQLFSSMICPNHFKSIGDSLNQSWRVYKSNLDPNVTQKFSSLLVTSLNTMGLLCDCIRSDYGGMVSLIEEILSITSSVFYLCPVPTLQCIRKVLKCIFSSYDTAGSKGDAVNVDSKVNDSFEKFLDFAENHHKLLIQHRRSSVSKTPSDKSALGSYIRQFEPIVITALKMYTTSSDVAIQEEVMKLLSQLIKGHVNYGLVDSNQVFLGFVIKQIGFLEEGQIRNADSLVREMFQFLTLLSHEHQPTKRFIDVPKILRLCDGLVASSYNSVLNSMSLGVASLRPVVSDLFIQRSSSSLTNLEKKEMEAQREVLLQMLIKLSTKPQVLSIMWLLVKGRKGSNETKWIADSKTLMNSLIPSLQHGTLKISSRVDFNSLVALLVSVSPLSLPLPETVVSVMRVALKTQNENMESFCKWSVLINSHVILLLKTLETAENVVPPDGLNASFILEMMYKFITDFSSIAVLNHSTASQFCLEQLKSFLQELVSLLKQSKLDNLRLELRSDENSDAWMRLVECVVKLSVTDPTMRIHIVEILSAILYNKLKIWDFVLNTSSIVSVEFLPAALISLMNELNETDVPVLEEWIIVNHSNYLLVHMSHPTVSLFLNRLSKYRLEQILDQITILLTKDVDVALGSSILKFFYRVYESFSTETAVLSLELFKKIEVPYLGFEISQFSCYVLSHIRIRRQLFSSSNQESLRQFLAIPSIELRYPRLFLNVQRVVNPENEKLTPRIDSVLIEAPVQQWCCSEISSTDGMALAKMLSNMTYIQIMNIFTQQTFNMSLLQYCFRYLHDLYLMDKMSAQEVTDLLTSEKRSGLMDKFPLGVAIFEFILETLDGWENFVSPNLLTFNSDCNEDIIQGLPFSQKLPQMWCALIEMLRLKSSVIKGGASDQSVCYNNFIPTTLFTASFQYMRSRCQSFETLSGIPLDNLQSFLTFASIAVCDSSFLNFFNIRDNSMHIFTCVLSLGCVLRKIVAAFNINFIFSTSGAMESYSEMNDTCAKVLIEFNYMTEFIFQVKTGKTSLPSILFNSFENVVVGLGRCELINGWVLISHLGWKPQAISKTQIFPAVQNIPLEILRDDNTLLLQYIFKLNLFGVASKIQFEENWMTFLSVINSYGDESFQLQIVCTGLRALSMMLEHSIKIAYIPETSNEKFINGLSKLDLVLNGLEPELCRLFKIPPLFPKSTKVIENQLNIDVNSCIRFLTDLFSQWLQNSQGKMPLLLLSEVVHSIVSMSEYFEDGFQYTWMYETLLEIHKSFEKEDEILWPHLMYGIFYAAAKITLEGEAITYLSQILETSLTSSNANVANASIKSALIFLQNHPDGFPVLNVIAPYVIKNTQLNETTNDTESHSCSVWTLLLFIWIHGPSENISGADFEQETIANILTILIPLNKVYVSVRLLVLKGLRAKLEKGGVSADTKKKISKLAIDTLKTPNVAIYFETVKLFLVIFYSDFKDVYEEFEPDPEALMQMAERLEVLFQLLKSSTKYNCQIISKVLPVIVSDFLPPSEILNRVIAEFMSPIQTSPELLASVVAQVFEKARRRSKDASLVREWIIASLPNFVSNPDVSRTMWSLTLFFIGVSKSNEIATLLPYAQLRRRSSYVKQLFVHSALDFYSSLKSQQKEDFRKLMSTCKPQGDETLPYSFLIDLINTIDFANKRWSKEISTEQ